MLLDPDDPLLAPLDPPDDPDPTDPLLELDDPLELSVAAPPESGPPPEPPELEPPPAPETCESLEPQPAANTAPMTMTKAGHARRPSDPDDAPFFMNFARGSSHAVAAIAQETCNIRLASEIPPSDCATARAPCASPRS